MRDCTKLSVDQIRQILVTEYGWTQADADDIKGKQNLAYTLYNCEKDVVEDEKPDFEELELETKSSDTDDSRVDCPKVNREENNDPIRGTLAWEGFVLSQLADNEKEEKNGNTYPKASGLRRLAELLLGPIIESGPKQVFAPQEYDYPSRATVIYEIVIDFSRGNEYDVRRFSEAADAWLGNTPSPFHLHPVATASTRAEGRALKKALQLTSLTAEEMSNVVPTEKPSKVSRETGEWKGDSPATANQIGLINSWCPRLKLDREKFIDRYTSGKNIETISREDAATLAEVIQQFSTLVDKDRVDIPEDIKASSPNV